jgi:outer membrane receptor for ferrienterochelin and colicin
MRPLPIILVSLLALAGAGAASAQTSCDDAVVQAQKSYDLGFFEDVPGQLAPCLGAKISRATALTVHSLLARSYFAADDLGKAREEISTLLRVDSAFEPGPPPRFAALVAEVRREQATAQVASVSRTKESLREAPATVVVITGEEIERRGYHDLEEVFHDLPGFDISRSNGEVYSTLYQRGFRSNTNDRNLLLLDGVEQNDLGTNAVYLSRQYPLSNIDRIEVVYGPTSTMYGANAYTGVISILTKDPEAIVPEGASLGARGQVTSGAYATRAADVTLAGHDRSSSLAWSLTARRFRSDEQDLSSYPYWGTNLAALDYRQTMTLTSLRAFAFCNDPNVAPLCAAGGTPLFTVARGSDGLPVVAPTPLAMTLARNLDQEGLNRFRPRFSDPTDDWMVYGRLRISNLTFGVEVWRLSEGTVPAVYGLFRPPGSVWTPQETALSMKYSRPLGPGLTFNALTRYLQTGLRRGDSLSLLAHTYGGSQLSFGDLFLGTKPWVQVLSYGEMSSQVKTELGLVYEPSEKLSAVGGLEVRKGSLESQPDLLSYNLENPQDPRALPFNVPNPEQIEHTDFAVYAQGSYRPWKELKLVAGGRLDYNQLDNRRASGSGFGALFTPRLAAIYTRGRSVFKAIYSEAFKDPTDFEKFGTLPFIRSTPSNGLRPERVRNVELSAGWQASEAVSAEIALYQANYRDVVAQRVVPGCQPSLLDLCGQLVNVDRFRVRGLQATARVRLAEGFAAFGNFTYTDPVETAPQDLLVGDIARYHLNAGITAEALSKLTLDLRGSYVGSRRTGAGTTVPTNPRSSIPSSFNLKAALTYGLSARWKLQLAGDNLLDRTIYDPGVTTAGFGFADILPQPGRTLYLRLIAASGKSADAHKE